MSKQTDNTFRNEHDMLFKAFFGVKETMLDYLHNFFPANLLLYIDIDSLNLDETNYRTPEMKAFESDTVYRAFFKLKNKKSRPLAIAFLLEHKSYPFAYIFVQLLTYMCRIWQNDIENKRKLSFIMPIVVYQNKKTWNYRPFSKLFPGLPKEFYKFIPSFEYHITKVNDIEKEILEKLKGVSILYGLFLAYQKLDDKAFVDQNLADFFILLDERPELKELFTMFFGYVTRKTELSADEFYDKYQKAKEKSLKSNFMSTYDSIVFKGKAEGITFGIVRLLKNGKLSIEEIAEVYEVTIEFILNIKKEHNL